MEEIESILSLIFIAWVIWMMASSLMHIQRSVGIVSPTGLSWTMVIIIGNLFGVILYRFFRDPIEDHVQRLLRRGLR